MNEFAFIVKVLAKPQAGIIQVSSMKIQRAIFLYNCVKIKKVFYMIVFFRNIPGDTQKSELAGFIKPVLKGGLFSAKGELKRVSIIAVTDKNINLTEYHALARIEPEAAAQRVIKKLHGQTFRGRRVTVRQYVTRNRNGDKRFSKSIEDRRRNVEIIEDVVPEYSSRKSFHRVNQ